MWKLTNLRNFSPPRAGSKLVLPASAKGMGRRRIGGSEVE